MYPPQYVPTTNGQATTAMWLGIAALLLCWTIIGGFVLGILAIVFGAISKGKPPASGKSNGAIIMGITAIILPILLIVAIQTLGTNADKSFRCTGAQIGSDTTNPFDDC